MARLYFDNPHGIIFVDGIKISSSYAMTEKSFCIQYFPFNASFQPVTCAVDGKPKCSSETIFIRHGSDYIVKFYPIKKPAREQCEEYLREIYESQNCVSHCLSCKCDGTYKIVVETENEIVYLDVDSRVISVAFKVTSIRDGQLIAVFAKLDSGKTYAAVMHYKDDYALLLSLYCDELTCDEDGLIVCDYLNDTLARKCVRRLTYKENCFCEVSRHFEKMCSHVYPDEILPYVLLESLVCGDVDQVRECLGYHLRDLDCKTFFGDFIAIYDGPDYAPYRITLIYAEENELFTKTYSFAISQGKIVKVNCL